MTMTDRYPPEWYEQNAEYTRGVIREREQLREALRTARPVLFRAVEAGIDGAQHAHSQAVIVLGQLADTGEPVR
jgi:hypothetical protein